MPVLSHVVGIILDYLPKIGWGIRVALATGFCLLLVALVAPVIGLGVQEHFILYRFVGISRRQVFFIGVGTLLIALASALFHSIKLQTQEPVKQLLSLVRPLAKRYSFTSTPAIERLNLNTGDEQRRIAIAVSLISVSVFLVLVGLPNLVPSRPLHVLPELIQAYDLADGSRQILGYRLAIVFVALCALCAKWLSRCGGAALFKFDGAVSPIIGLLMLGLPVLSWLVGLHTDLLIACLASALGGLLYLFLIFSSNRALKRLVSTLVVIVYVALIIVPGFFRPVLLLWDTPYDIAQMELHLVETVLPSSIMAAGFHLFRDFIPNYGLLLQVFVAMFERHFGFLDVGGQIRVVQISQAGFLLLAVAVLYRVRRSFLPTLFPLAIVAPYLTTAGLAIWHPNQSGIRHLGFPLGLLLLQLAGRLSLNYRALLLGFGGGVLLTINVETGIAIICGFAFYFYLQLRLWRDLISIVILAGLGLLGAFAMLLLLYGIGLGYWIPLPTLMAGLRELFARLSGGFTGSLLFVAAPNNINLVFVPLAFALTIHGFYLVMLSALRASSRPLSERELFLASVAVILVVWLNYYYNFPSWWNLWVPLFLYAVILTVLYDPHKMRMLLARPLGLFERPWMPVTIMLVVMACGDAHNDLINFNRNHFFPSWHLKDRGVELAGVLVPTKLASSLSEKAAYLEDAARGSATAYATVNSDFMPTLSHVYQVGIQRDFWTLAYSDNDIRQQIENLSKRNIAKFLLDDQGGPLAVGGARLSYQRRISRITAEYFVFSERYAGWDVWVSKEH